MQQTETTTAQTGPTTVQSGPATVETGGTTVQTEQVTLHDFTLGLLTDLDAREAFQQDPLGCLEAAGLGDITAADVHDILPLVLDAASVPNVDVLDNVLAGTELPAVDSLLQIAGTVEGVTGVTDLAAPTAITALVSDFSGLGDVSSTLDAGVHTATEVVSNVPSVVSNVADIAHDNSVVTTVTDVANVHDVTNTLVKDIDTDAVVKDVVDTNVLVKNVVSSVDVHDVVDVSHHAVQDVAQVGDVHHEVGQVIGDVNVANIGNLDLLHDGVGNGNHVDVIHF